MPTTVTQFIHSSFRLIGAIAAGETLETAELNDALVSLNQMVSTWNTEGASVCGRQFLNINIFPGINSYLVPQRPIKIQAASAHISGVDNALEIVDAVGWEAIPTPEKAMQSIFIRKLFCDYLYPTSRVYIWPVPRLAGIMEVWIYAVIAQFSSLAQEIDLPPGYETALRYNFALSLLPEYPRSQVDPTLPAQAQTFKASIMQLNASNQMTSAAGLLTPPTAPDAIAR